MKSRKKMSLVVSLLLLSLTLAPVSTALAAEPDVEQFHSEGSFQLDCGDFLILADFVEEVRVTTFFDQAGDPISLAVHVNYDATLTNSETGKTVRDPNHFTVLVDIQQGIETWVGLVFGITVPGEGMAVIDAGRVVFDEDGNVIFEAGPHPGLQGGLDAVCAALD